MSSHTPAYEVPFWIDRHDAPHLYRLVNLSDEMVRGVRCSLLGPGYLVPLRPTDLGPGVGVTLTLIGSDLSRSSVVVVRWFRENDDEYLWRFSF
ncbi:hypothetical protein [Frondihabitans cladoniiphilus]|uniref:PilZ domain-containing protein n=1 Tax=Frondihabitans cladoniiphilus TaxID=715785 RepID=A0ABP8VU91_9MICO